MGWATPYIEKLLAGETVQFRPRGNSMAGKVPNGALVTVAPIQGTLFVGDVVLCKVNGNQYLHLIKAKRADGTYQIGNAKGGINGWTSTIYGVLLKVEP
jgi:hypothetical protein